MKLKQVIKIGIDTSMAVLLFVLMVYHYVGAKWHEVTGAAMLVLFILHHILNGNWYKALGKGKYSSGRILLMIVGFVKKTRNNFVNPFTCYGLMHVSKIFNCSSLILHHFAISYDT